LQAVGLAEGEGFTLAVDGGAGFPFHVAHAVINADGFCACDKWNAVRAKRRRVNEDDINECLPSVRLLAHYWKDHTGGGPDQPGNGKSSFRKQPANGIGFRLAATILNRWYDLETGIKKR